MNYRNSQLSFIDGRLRKKVVLLVLDGWGTGQPYEGNAISEASTPVFDRLIASYPSATLLASGEAVGLRKNESGSCLSGYLNLGAGRTLNQGARRIDKEVSKGFLRRSEEMLKIIEHVQENQSTLHLIGTFSAFSVKYFEALVNLVKNSKIKEVEIHLIMEKGGVLSDVEVQGISHFQVSLSKIGLGRIASILDRDCAMNIENDWQKTSRTYHDLSDLPTDFCDNILTALERWRSNENNLSCVHIAHDNLTPKLKSGDAVVFIEEDYSSIGQLALAISSDDFDKFPRPVLKNVLVASFGDHRQNLPVLVIFPEEEVIDTLSDCISALSLRQAKISDAEKLGYLSFFFNGKKGKTKFEDWRFVDFDLKGLENYSTNDIARETIKSIEGGEYDFMVVSLGSADVAGKLGDFDSSKRLVEVIDGCIGDIIKSALDFGYALILTSDHGNIEYLLDMKTGQVDRRNTSNPVPFIVIAREYEGQNFGWSEAAGGDLSLAEPVGSLADVAPTILNIMGVKKPKRMTGRSLI